MDKIDSLGNLNRKIFLVAGRTGSGKDTLVNAVAQKYGLKVLKSYTTRPRRNSEGDTHIFIQENEWDSYKDDVLAYTEINGYRYFSTKEQLNQNDIYIIDPNGIQLLKDNCDQDVYDFIIVYIDLDYETRLDRAVNERGDDREVFMKRNQSEDEQFTQFENDGEWDYYIVNDDFRQAVSQFERIIDIEQRY